MDFEPGGSPELVLSLFPFGISENGDVIGWDLEDEQNGEFTIYRIGSRAYGVKRVARTPFETVEKCLDEARGRGDWKGVRTAGGNVHSVGSGVNAVRKLLIRSGAFFPTRLWPLISSWALILPSGLQ